MKTTKKAIEVALPLEAINAACAREKSIRHGHPSMLHLWRPVLERHKGIAVRVYTARQAVS